METQNNTNKELNYGDVLTVREGGRKYMVDKIDEVHCNIRCMEDGKTIIISIKELMNKKGFSIIRESK